MTTTQAQMKADTAAKTKIQSAARQTRRLRAKARLLAEQQQCSMMTVAPVGSIPAQPTQAHMKANKAAKTKIQSAKRQGRQVRSRERLLAEQERQRSTMTVAPEQQRFVQAPHEPAPHPPPLQPPHAPPSRPRSLATNGGCSFKYSGDDEQSAVKEVRIAVRRLFVV